MAEQALYIRPKPHASVSTNHRTYCRLGQSSGDVVSDTHSPLVVGVGCGVKERGSEKKKLRLSSSIEAPRVAHKISHGDGVTFAISRGV